MVIQNQNILGRLLSCCQWFSRADMYSAHIKFFIFFLRPIISEHAVIDFQPTAQARTTSSITVPARKREPVSQSTFFFPSCFVRPQWPFVWLGDTSSLSLISAVMLDVARTACTKTFCVRSVKKPKKFNMCWILTYLLWKSPARKNSENMRNILRHLVKIFLSKTSWNC